MTSRPLISVLLPTYQGEAYLSSALEGLVAQTDQDFEVIAVDDGSTDSTVEILNSFAQLIDMTVMCREREGNWVSNTNRALAHARADLVSVLHQDDRWQVDRVRRLKEAVENHPRAVLFVHPVTLIDASGREVGVISPVVQRAHGSTSVTDLSTSLLVQNTVMMPSPAFMLDAARRVGGFDEDLWYTADWKMWLDLCREGEVVFIPECLADFRIHAGSLTVAGVSSVEEMRRQQLKVLDHVLCRDRTVPSAIQKAARFSVEVNCGLARGTRGSATAVLRLLPLAIGLGPRALLLYFRHARIFTRTGVRLGLLRGR